VAGTAVDIVVVAAAERVTVAGSSEYRVVTAVAVDVFAATFALIGLAL
jgi:hypothetical protein